MQKRLFILVVGVLFGSMVGHARFYNHPDSAIYALDSIPDSEKTMAYHELANYYNALDENKADSLCGLAYALIYETEAVIWEYTHDAEPWTMGTLMYNIAYYYSRMECYYKAASYMQVALSFYAQHVAVDSVLVQEAEAFAHYCDSMAENYLSAVYLNDSLEYKDHPTVEDSTINFRQTYYTAAHYLDYPFKWYDKEEEESLAILQLLESRHLDELTDEERCALYYELVEREQDRHQYAAAIRHAKQFIECAPRTEENSARYSTVLLNMRCAASDEHMELEQLPFLAKHQLHEAYADMLFEYARNLRRADGKAQAEKVEKQAWQYAKKHKATRCSLCLEELSSQAMAQMAQKNYKAAADLFDQVLGKDNIAKPYDLANAMLANYRIGRYKKGWEIEQCLMRAPGNAKVTYKVRNGGMIYANKLQIHGINSTGGSFNVENADIRLENTTVDTMRVYNVDMQVDSAARYHIEAQVRVDSLTMEKQHRNLAEFHSESRYLDDLHAFTQVLINQGDYVLADELCSHSLDVIQYFHDVLPESYIARANYYMALIDAYKGDWKHMLTCAKAAYPYYEEMGDDMTMAQLLVLVSQYYQHFYHYERAFDIAQDAVEVLSRKPVDQYNPDKVVYVYLNWVKCLFEEGYFSDGLHLLDELTDYVVEKQGRKHINLAQIYLEFLRHAELYRYDYQHSIDVLFETYGILSEHMDELLATDNLARIFGKDYVDFYTISSQIFGEVRDDTAAMDCADKAMRYTAGIYGEHHPYILTPLMKQQKAYLTMGGTQSALKNCKFGITIAKDAYGEHHWTVGDMQWCVAECYLALNDYAHFELYADSVVENFKYNIRHEFTFLTAAQRADYWERQNRILSAISEQALLHQSPKLQQLAYDISLLIKGMLLKTQTEIFEIVERSGDEDLRYMYMELLQLNEQQRLSVEKNLPFTKEQQQQKEALEKQIQQRVLQYGDYTEVMAIRWEHVRKALKTNEVAIEFVTLPQTEDSVLYCAMVLRKGSSQPELIPLFWEQDAKAMMKTKYETQLNATYRYDEYGQLLAQLVWGKLMAAIRPGEKVYFAPVGILYQLAIEALPYDEKRTMEDVYDLVRVSSTRELTFRKKAPKHSAATLYGGIQYDLPTDISEEPVEYLPGTYVEAEAIGEMLRQNKVRVKLFSSTLADEASFKGLSGTHQNILHIGTHGFFRMEEDYEDDPLYRCGLLFADGVLNGKEISLLDLKAADLVVLSACETAKGEVTGEGVFGLQRAFKQAGAQTIIMSLWEVNDDATELLITEFYRNWIVLHQTKRDALHNARNAVRNARDEKGELLYEEPIYWASFIMLD